MKYSLIITLFLIVPTSLLFSQTGEVFVYPQAMHGKKFKSGHVYQHNQLSCGHATIPVGSAVRVVNLTNNQSVDLLVNDVWQGAASNIIVSGHAAAILKMPKGKRVKMRLERLSHPGSKGVVTQKAVPKRQNTKTPTTPGLYFLEFSSYKTEILATRFTKKLAKAGVAAKVAKAPDGLHYVISNGYYANLESASTAFYQAKDKAGYVPTIKRL